MLLNSAELIEVPGNWFYQAEFSLTEYFSNIIKSTYTGICGLKAHGGSWGMILIWLFFSNR